MHEDRSAPSLTAACFDLRLLEPFVVLADEDLHFRVAAERLGIGQPALSRQMARLQRQLRASLLIRDQRRNLLAPAGERFLAHARTVLLLAGTLRATLRAGSDVLRIHMGSGAHRGARDLVTSFVAAHPQTGVAIEEGPSAQARDRLVRHEVDVAFDLRTKCPAGIRFEPLYESPLGLLTGADHPLARRGHAAWPDLRGEPVFFGRSDDGSWNALVRGCLQAAGVVVEERIAPPLPALEYLVPLIAAGTASMITARALFDPLPGDLAWTPLTPHQRLEYGLLWDPDRTRGSSVRSFVDFARRHACSDSGAPARPPATSPGSAVAAPAVGTHEPGRTTVGFDLRLVQPFVVVAQEMHFGRAPELLVIAQPALSRQVARLESQLGVTMFDRTRRRVALTEMGRLTLAAGREILTAGAQAQLSVQPERTDLHAGTRLSLSG